MVQRDHERLARRQRDLIKVGSPIDAWLGGLGDLEASCVGVHRQHMERPIDIADPPRLAAHWVVNLLLGTQASRGISPN